MKAKQMLSILTLLAICLFVNAQEKPHCLYQECGFDPGQIVYLFGDQVQLREAPHTESKVLKTLPIGSHMAIIEKHEHSWRYKGMDHHFYKVDYKGTEGYILGGLLALDKKVVAGTTHIFGRSRVDNTNYLLIRTLNEKGGFAEKSIRLGNDQFYLSDLGTKGLNSIDGVLLVDYVSGDTEKEGGGIYLFQKNGKLHTAARLSQMVKANENYFWEELIFPEDEHGVAGKIRYKKQIGEYYDKVANWKKTSTETKELVWEHNTLGIVQN